MNVGPAQRSRSVVPSAAALAAALVAWSLTAGSASVLAQGGSAGRASAQGTAEARFAAPAAGEPVQPVNQPIALGAATLASTLESIGTVGRVLMIGAHPDDEDTQLIAWLARGRHVETAYLSLTRGDGGQNLIGNELGDMLGVIRTEELLAARRIDGGRQYFTRAFDFGFSKNAEESFQTWPRDEVLSDVVRVVRAFRPQVIVAVFSGTPRDGHGHHQVSGQLALAAYEQAADTVAFPVATHGLPFTPDKFYRAARFAPQQATLRMNVGEYSPLFGRSYYEIASESRSQHKSQGFGVLQRRGAEIDFLLREATRAPAPSEAAVESSLFDGIDTSWTGLAQRTANLRARSLLDSADVAFTEARTRYRAEAPDAAVAPLARGLAYLRAVRDSIGPRPPEFVAAQPGWTARLLRADGSALEPGDATPAHADAVLWDAITLTEERAALALVLAAGVAVEATAPRRLLPSYEFAKRGVPDTLGVTVNVFNRGRQSVVLAGAGMNALDSLAAAQLIRPDSSTSIQRTVRRQEITMPWWRSAGREGAMFRAPIDGRDAAARQHQSQMGAVTRIVIAGVPVDVRVPVVNRFADPVKGDQQIQVAVVPGITIGLERVVEYARANEPIERQVRVSVLSAYPSAQPVTIELDLPAGLTADSAARERTLEPDVALTVTFTVRGRLTEGMHTLKATALHQGVPSQAGYYAVNYPHITPQRSYSASTMYLSAVPIAVAPGTRVGYIAGVSDDGLAALLALDIPAEELAPAAIANSDLSRFSAIVIGPRAYQVSDELRAANPKLFAWAEAGGTLVVQYGQYEMQEPGVMPYPVTLTRPAARVTREDAEVRALAPDAGLMRFPNRIGESDWRAWVQERSTYMPSTFDARYRPLLEMHDPGEKPERGALLAAPLGKGVYVYSTLALFRQLPVGVPGGARLLVNLISAKASGLPTTSLVP